jgi:hypothetical protein
VEGAKEEEKGKEEGKKEHRHCPRHAFTRRVDSTQNDDCPQQRAKELKSQLTKKCPDSKLLYFQIQLMIEFRIKKRLLGKIQSKCNDEERKRIASGEGKSGLL